MAVADDGVGDVADAADTAFDADAAFGADADVDVASASIDQIVAVADVVAAGAHDGVGADTELPRPMISV